MLIRGHVNIGEIFPRSYRLGRDKGSNGAHVGVSFIELIVWGASSGPVSS